MNTEEIQLLQQGDRMAQHRVYETLAPQMLSICRRYISNVMDAESVMIDGFFKVFTTIEQLQNSASFEAWVRRIMVREALQYIRKNKTIDFIEDLNVEEVNIEESQELVLKLSQEQLFELICDLPMKARMVFNLYVLYNYSHKEIAAELNISEATSKSHLKWARKGLKEKIGSINNAYSHEGIG